MERPTLSDILDAFSFSQFVLVVFFGGTRVGAIDGGCGFAVDEMDDGGCGWIQGGGEVAVGMMRRVCRGRFCSFSWEGGMCVLKG